MVRDRCGLEGPVFYAQAGAWSGLGLAAFVYADTVEGAFRPGGIPRWLYLYLEAPGGAGTMKTGIIDREVAATWFAVSKVTAGVASGDIVSAALSRRDEYGYYTRRFCEAVERGPFKWTSHVTVNGGAQDLTVLVTFAYDENLTVEVDGDVIPITSLFSNGAVFAARIATDADPHGVSGASEAIWIDLMEVGPGDAGMRVSASLLPVAATAR